MTNTLDQCYDLLLLDDSPEDREVYKRRLSALPGVEFRITEAGSCEEAMRVTLGHHFDCYIIDYSLPDASGLDFIRYLLERRKENIHSAALIIITGHGNEDVASEAFKLGVHEYLTKKALIEGSFARPLMNAIEKAQMMTQLQSFREQLERSHRDLSDFTHTAAHDLKSPLRRIMSYCEILEEDAAERLNDEEKGILQRMHVNAKRMRELIDSLLTYSLVNTNDEEKREVDLYVMVSEIVNDLQPQLKELGGTITIKSLPKASVYQIRMRQLFENLISNAVKYRSEKQPKIEIQSYFEDNVLVVSIADNGLGISPAECEEVFKDFKRLHTNEEIEGSGLGLSICKKIVQRHGGDIWVESEVGEGSTFYFTLKMDPAE